ncbi:MAG TPA: alkaline phosphatase PhoX, partial [Enhygromyxa sp.]|nr:alkaline phosphatase PhoX [Enhygromyxa sp.]
TNSCLYRFVPDDMAEPFIGKLQALKIVGQDTYNTLLMGVGEVLDVEWVDIDEPDPDDDTVREEAQSKGAAIIIRGEGIWFFEGQIYVCSTAGGLLGKGQIFRLIDGDRPTLELIVSVDDASMLDNPDNITVAPWGDVFIAEDGDGDQYIRWINTAGEICDFARNAASTTELAGVCFSPSGDALFLNMFGEGLTVVVTGPFPGVGPGDGDGDPGDGDGDSGDGDGDTASSTEDEGGNETGETGDEVGETGDPGLGDGDDGCNCSADQSPSAGVAVTLATIAGVAALTRSRDES